MSVKITMISLDRDYSTGAWSIRAHFQANGFSGHSKLPQEAVDEIMSVAIRCVNASLPQMANEVAAAVIPSLPPPPAPIQDAVFTDVADEDLF